MAKTTVAVQTKLPEFNKNSELFVEGGFSEDNQLFVARILTKVRPHSNKITIQVTNLSDLSVYLPKCTDIAEVAPFVEQCEGRIEIIELYGGTRMLQRFLLIKTLQTIFYRKIRIVL